METGFTVGISCAGPIIVESSLQGQHDQRSHILQTSNEHPLISSVNLVEPVGLVDQRLVNAGEQGAPIPSYTRQTDVLSHVTVLQIPHPAIRRVTRPRRYHT